MTKPKTTKAPQQAVDQDRGPLSVPELRWWDVDELEPVEYNPRAISGEEFDALAAGVEEFGLVQPLVVNVHPERRGRLVGGFQRWRVARSRGQRLVPVVEVDLDPARERELNARLNANGGRFDWGALAESYGRDELAAWGFRPTDLEAFDAAAAALEKAGAAEAPDEFPPVDETLAVDHECPRCRFRWSGGSAPRVAAEELDVDQAPPAVLETAAATAPAVEEDG